MRGGCWIQMESRAHHYQHHYDNRAVLLGTEMETVEKNEETSGGWKARTHVRLWCRSLCTRVLVSHRTGSVLASSGWWLIPLSSAPFSHQSLHFFVNSHFWVGSDSDKFHKWLILHIGCSSLSKKNTTKTLFTSRIVSPTCWNVLKCGIGRSLNRFWNWTNVILVYTMFMRIDSELNGPHSPIINLNI